LLLQPVISAMDREPAMYRDLVTVTTPVAGSCR